MHTKRQCAPYMTNYGSTSEAGSAYPSGKREFTLSFNGICIALSLVFCVVF
jgi:hypothetical protein